MRRIRCLATALPLALASLPTLAGPLPSFPDLERILGDRGVFEDFEGVSLPGGTLANAPNPQDSDAAPAWNLEPGVVYGSPDTLTLYASWTNVLAARGGPPATSWSSTLPIRSGRWASTS